MLQVRSHRRHGQRGRVGRQDALGGDNRLHLGEHLLLDVQFLEHGLDDEVRVGKSILGNRSGDQRLGAVGGVGTDPFLRQHFVHFSVDIAHAFVHAGLVDVRHHDGDLELPGEEQGKLAGHQACAHHAHLGHRPGQFAVRCAGRALGALLHEVQERVDRGAELVGLHEAGQGLALERCRVPLAHGPVGLHDVQDLGRRG
ncbi:hypothetical protein D9M72_477450 [compost metagenome]